MPTKITKVKVNKNQHSKFFPETQKLLRSIELHLKMPVITYWNSFDGSVCNSDVNAIYKILNKTGKQKQVALFIKSDGGQGEASLRIVNLLRQFFGKVIALVPLECASAATMLAMGADEIHMGPLSNLTAIDTSLEHKLSPLSNTNSRVAVSLDELGRVIKLWKKHGGVKDRNPYEVLYSFIHPLVIGAIDRSESLSTRICEEILSYHMKDLKKIKSISHQLNAQYPSHSYPITQREAKRIGLNVLGLDSKVNELLLKLNMLYSEMGDEKRKDFDKHNYYTNAVLNIMESAEIQVIYQCDKVWHYVLEEKRWRSTNDESSWYFVEKTKSGIKKNKLFIN